MKITAKAPANIAFIKYWGKRDEALRLPENSSVSMNLDSCFTQTTVDFDKKYKKDSFELLGEKTKDKEKQKVFDHLERIRKLSNIAFKAKVVSKNSFPKSTGMASSASGFAALTLAGTKSAGLNLNQKELSILARIGSGSACRSIPNGFVKWNKGDNNSSYSYSLYKPDYWNILDIICLVQDRQKKTSSTAGMENARSSPFFEKRLFLVEKKLTELEKALKEKNFEKFGEILEQEAINMHAVMMTQNPALFYWQGITFDIIKSVYLWRENGLSVFFTIDAGPNVHLICQEKDKNKILGKIKIIKGIKKIIVNRPAVGARIINQHML